MPHHDIETDAPLPRERLAILEALDAAWAARPRMTSLEIARRLSICEGQLQAARLGRDVVTLPLPPAALTDRFPDLGRVEVLTRSGQATLRQQARSPLHITPLPDTLSASGGIDLCLRFGHWHWACLIRDTRSERIGLQVFDRHGRALLELRSLDTWPNRGWRALERLGTCHPPVFTGQALPGRRPLPEAPGLAEDWTDLVAPDHLGPVLRRHGLNRHEAYALLEGRFTRALPPEAVSEALTLATRRALPMTLSVASPGCRQRRTGTLPASLARGGGEAVALHLDATAIAEAWMADKPSHDGDMTSLEAFDAHGEQILQLDTAPGADGRPKDAWRDLLSSLSPRRAAVA